MRFFAFLARAGKPHDSSRSAESAPGRSGFKEAVSRHRGEPSRSEPRSLSPPRHGPATSVTRSLDQSFATAVIKLTAITMSAPICFTTSRGGCFCHKFMNFVGAQAGRVDSRPSRPCWCRQCPHRDAMVLEPLQDANVGHTQRTTTFKCNSNCGTGRRWFLGIESPCHRHRQQREQLGPASEIRAGHTPLPCGSLCARR
jgi:hypothetical protein